MPEKKKGRPKVEFGDKEIAIINEAASLFTTKEELAELLMTPLNVLEKRVKAFTGNTLDNIIKKAETSRKLALKRTMFKLAERNGTVAVYLSKTHVDNEQNQVDDKFDGLEVEIIDGSLKDEDKE